MLKQEIQHQFVKWRLSLYSQRSKPLGAWTSNNSVLPLSTYQAQFQSTILLLSIFSFLELCRLQYSEYSIVFVFGLLVYLCLPFSFTIICTWQTCYIFSSHFMLELSLLEVCFHASQGFI